MTHAADPEPSAAVAAALVAAAPAEAETNGDVPLHVLCRSLRARMDAFLAEEVQTESLRRLQKRTRASMSVIEEALRKYDLQSLSLSYNGGKDCLVLLILYLAALPPFLSSSTDALESIYIVPPHPFAEVEAFVQASARSYCLALVRLQRSSLRSAFEEYLGLRPKVQAIFVGTRRTDPHGAKLSSFDATDHGWPAFMRVHPVIDWRYADIWAFIRHFSVPYSSLYDRGYTSLGGTTDTLPNPRLHIAGTAYRPAYELQDDDEERLGRE